MVLEIGNGVVFIADGKRRKLAKPKQKNVAHVAVTDIVIPVKDVTGNKKLKALLKSTTQCL